MRFRHPSTALASSLLAAFSLAPSLAREVDAASRDGRNLDSGATMSAPAEGAPAELKAAVPLLGTWRVRLEIGAGESATALDCEAEVSLFNRGHGYMERLRCPGPEQGHGPSTLALMTYNPANGVWVRGEANSATESIAVSHGQLENGLLTLRDAVRPGGGAVLRHTRFELDLNAEPLEATLQTSVDGGDTWQVVERRTYSRTEQAPRLARREDHGVPAEGLPPEARQFDFLIGDWTAQNELTFPNGQKAQWQADAVGIHVLDGHAVLEYHWFDVDPQLPDAATTIVRIYNRAMRRWESLYMPNRGHTILHFGGRWEGDRMVLHLFGTNTSAPSISRFIFHSIEPDRFGWYGEASTDRGRTFTKNWIIDTRRKARESTAD